MQSEWDLTCPEWRHTAEQDVEDDSGAPYIGLGPVMPPQHLGCNIVGTANNVREELPCTAEARTAIGGLYGSCLFS
jgi:hypothetical protein